LLSLFLCHKERYLRSVKVLLTLVLTFLALTPVMTETPSQLPKALEVLKKFSGVWETRTRICNEGPPRREFNTRGKATCRQTLEGRYFEFRSQSIPAGQADLQVMTYDVQAGVYRQWVFDSDGYYHQAEGKWEPANSTLRWQGKTADASFVIEDHWISADRLEWTLVRTDAGGRKLQTIAGTLIRVRDH
jgi:hypothetical protein